MNKGAACGLALAAAAALVAAFLFAAPSPVRAHHQCAATGSPFGPFDIETYEAADYKNVYARTLELAGFNQLFPELPSFSLPRLETGDRAAGSNQAADPYIPPLLLKAIASLESSWAQGDYSVPYGSVGPVLASHDCGYGIMQVTSGMQNVTGVPNLDQAMIGGHFAFNIARGAHILAGKWNLAPELRPLVGNRDPQLIENWYYAVWGYNGFAFKNHPLNPDYDLTRSQFSCAPDGDGLGHDRSQYPYQEMVLGCLAHPPLRGGSLLWDQQEVHLPDLSDPQFAGPLKLENWNPCSFDAQCAAMDIPTPNTNHRDPTALSVDRGQVIGSPVLNVSQGQIALVDITGIQQAQAALTISNAGSGALAYRATTTASWLKLSRSQGVALGADLGARTSTLTVRAEVSGLALGTHTAQVNIESLFAVGAPFTVGVTLNVSNLPDGTLVRGSGPDVFILQSGYKRHLVSPQNFAARGFSWADVVSVPDDWLATVPTGQPLLDALATGNLLKGSAPDVWVMEAGRKRHVVDPQTFLGCGYYWDAIRTAPDILLSSITTGPPLSVNSCPSQSFADGTLLQGSDAGVWVMTSGHKRWATSPEVFLSCGYWWANINRMADSTLAAIPGGRPLTLCTADGALVRGSAPDVYILQAGYRRHLVSPENFVARSFSWEDVAVVPDSWLGAVPTGQPLLDALATGSLLKGSAPGVWVMEAGRKRHAVDPQTFLGCGYYWDAIMTVPDLLLSSIATGPPLNVNSCPRQSFADGTLLQGSDAGVWVMAGGMKRWATSPEVFVSCGYSWANINRVAGSTLAAIPSGQPLSLCSS